MRLKDITKWDAGETRTIYVASNVCAVPLKLSVRKFVPLPHDSVHRGWMDGINKKFWPTTPFAIVNMHTALKDMEKYIAGNIAACIECSLHKSEGIVKKTYEYAQRYLERIQASLRKITALSSTCADRKG